MFVRQLVSASNLNHTEVEAPGGVTVSFHVEGGAYANGYCNEGHSRGFAHNLGYLDDLTRFNKGTHLSVGDAALIQGF